MDSSENVNTTAFELVDSNEIITKEYVHLNFIPQTLLSQFIQQSQQSLFASRHELARVDEEQRELEDTLLTYFILENENPDHIYIQSQEGLWLTTDTSGNYPLFQNVEVASFFDSSQYHVCDTSSDSSDMIIFDSSALEQIQCIYSNVYKAWYLRPLSQPTKLYTLDGYRPIHDYFHTNEIEKLPYTRICRPPPNSIETEEERLDKILFRITYKVGNGKYEIRHRRRIDTWISSLQKNDESITTMSPLQHKKWLYFVPS